MTRRPALVLSASVAARNPHVAATPAPKRPAPRTGTLDAAAGAVHHRRSTPGAGVVVVEGADSLRVTLDGLALPSLANLRSWRVKAKATKLARNRVYAHTHPLPGTMAPCGALAPLTPPPFPLVVTVTRVSARMLDPTDNLPVSAKGVIDAVALWLGVDDRRDPRVRYVVEQRKGPTAVEIALAVDRPNVVRLRVRGDALAAWADSARRDGRGELRAADGTVVEVLVEGGR